MLLMYFVAVPGALVVRRPLPGFRYAFARSLEDVVALSLLRAGAVTLAYWSGAGAKRHKCVLFRHASRHTGDVQHPPVLNVITAGPVAWIHTLLFAVHQVKNI